MRQALHIFVKDVRRLRFAILVALALTALFAWGEGHTGPLYGMEYYPLANMTGWLRFFLILAWWYLAAEAVYGEPLRGDSQFWVTRPYRWESLLLAKLLFIATFINVPFFLSDCAIVALQGFHPLAHPAALSWHQLAISVFLLLPMTALACLTKGLGQLALVSLAIPIGLALLGTLIGRGAAVSIQADSVVWVDGLLFGAMLLVASAIILLLQYRTRRAWPSRIVIGVVVILILCGDSLVPFDRAFALQSHLLKSRLDTSSVSFTVQSGKTLAMTTEPEPPTLVRVALPMALVGLPSGTIPVGDEVQAQLYGAGANRWQAFGVEVPAVTTAAYAMVIDRTTFERLKNTLLRIHVTAYLSIFGDVKTATMPLREEPYHLAGVGICQAQLETIVPLTSGETFQLRCVAPFRRPARVLAGVNERDQVQPLGFGLPSPYPAEFGISPMSTWGWNLKYQVNAPTIVFTTMQPLAHIRRDLDIPNVRLTDLAHTP